MARQHRQDRFAKTDNWLGLPSVVASRAVPSFTIMGMESGNAGGSGAARKSLGRKLKALRETGGFSTTDVATTKIVSRDKLWRLEKGRSPVKQGDILALCRLYKADVEETDALVELAEKTTVESFWEQYADLMPSRLGALIEMEGAAFQVRNYDPELVYGLLQTSAYHRAVATADLQQPDGIDRQIELRAERQRVALGRDVPLQIVSVMGPGAVLRRVGGESVMDGQLKHLLIMNRLPHVEVLVLPWGAGAHAAMRGAFTIVNTRDEDSGESTNVVYLESLGIGRYEEKGKLVQSYDERFDLIRAQSINIEEYLK